MKFLLSTILLAASTLSVAAKEPLPFFSDDPAMTAAIEKARSGLPTFWEHAQSPAAGEKNFMVKVAITDSGEVEHVWCQIVSADAAGQSCAIANAPQKVSTVKIGDQIDVVENDISDWMFIRGEKIVGAETQKVIWEMQNGGPSPEIDTRFDEP